MTKGKEITIWYLVAMFYILPLLISAAIIINTKHLLGDFVSIIARDNSSEILIVSVLYILPLPFIALSTFFAEKIRIGSKSRNRNYESYLFITLLIVTALATIFGLPSIGGGADLNDFSIIQSLILKLNPTLIFLIFSFSNSSKKKFILACICILYIGYLQKSLLPVFLVVIGTSTYWLKRENVSPLKLFVYTFFTLGLVYGFSDIISYLYQLRNDLRGSSELFDSELVISYAIGRINSFSSLYYIWSEGCCSKSPDSFYLLNNVLQRFIGIQLPTFSPTQAFNDHYLGADSYNYAIFISYSGQFLIEWQTNPAFLIITIVSAFLLVFFTYKLTPLPSNAEKPPLFLLVFYPSYLSGEAWEFSIMIQSLVVIRIIFYFVSYIKRHHLSGYSKKYSSS